MALSWKAGDPAAICDVCGFSYYHSDLKKRWDGLLVCDPDYEERHPQDSLKARKDKIFVDDPRPEATDYFLSVTEVVSTDL